MKTSEFTLLLFAGALTACFAEVHHHLLERRGVFKDLTNLIHHYIYPFFSNKGTKYGVCIVKPSTVLQPEQSVINGFILFRQTLPTKDVEGYFQLEGIPKFYAKLSVHQYGEVTDTCNATGPQYNPMELEQEYGDIPKVEVKLGNIGQYLHSLQLTLFGPHSIYGRSVVVRAGELTEEKADKKVPLAGVGHSGKVLACCTVAVSDKYHWKKVMRNDSTRASYFAHKIYSPFT